MTLFKRFIPFVLLALFAGCDLLLEDNGGGGGTDPVKPSKNNNTWGPGGTDKPFNSNLSGKLKDFLPEGSRGDVLKHYTYYTVSYSSKHKNPEWTAYELTSEQVGYQAPDADRRSHSFKADPATQGTANTKDYTNTGYDRGHLVPAADMNFSSQAMEETFFMTNISPQVPDFNRGIWKSLEDKVRDWAAADRRIYVITGAVLPKQIRQDMPKIGEANDIIVPKTFYKVVLDYEGPEKKGIAFLIPNEASSKPLKSFACSIKKVEEAAGLNFFPKLSAAEQADLEGAFDVTKWKGL